MANNKDKPLIRTINIKLVSTEDDAKFLNDYIDYFTLLHDAAVNRYTRSGQLKPLGIEGAKMNYLNKTEKKEFRDEFSRMGCSGTFIDLAIGQSGAEAYYKAKLNKARRDTKFIDKQIKKMETENPNLLKPKSIWFNKVNNKRGTCTICSKTGDMPRQSNQPEYKDEYLCDVCEPDFFRFHQQIRSLMRYVRRYYEVCKKITEEKEVSESLMRLLDKYTGAPSIPLKNTITNKALIKKNTLKIDFENKTASIKTRNGHAIQVKFNGEGYYTDFPRYGYNSDINKFKKLISNFLQAGGYPSILRKTGANGINAFFLSIPTHYPAPLEKLPVCGHIIISNRSVVIYINGKPTFIKLYRVYMKKRIFEAKRSEIDGHNDELLLFEWNQVPKRNRKLLRNLKKKLGYDWCEDTNSNVSISDNGKKININSGKESLEIAINDNGTTAELTASNGDMRTLYIEEIPSRDETYIKANIYLQPPIQMPIKYSEGNLAHYIRHQNQVTARLIVEKVKEKLAELGKNVSIALIDYTYLHTEGEKNVVTPITNLNTQIKNMLQYDGIYGGDIPWTRLKKITCPHCNREFEKSENRLIIRDILISKINSWVCDCDHRINNPLIAVCRNINTNIEELLKPLTSKDKKEGEISEREQVPVLSP